MSFYDKKLVKPYWFGAKQEENVCWEKWILRFHFTGIGQDLFAAAAVLSSQWSSLTAGTVTSQPIMAKDKTALADSVVRRIHFILKMVNAQQEHVPVGALPVSLWVLMLMVRSDQAGRAPVPLHCGGA